MATNQKCASSRDSDPASDNRSHSHQPKELRGTAANRVRQSSRSQGFGVARAGRSSGWRGRHVARIQSRVSRSILPVTAVLTGKAEGPTARCCFFPMLSSFFVPQPSYLHGYPFVKSRLRGTPTPEKSRRG